MADLRIVDAPEIPTENITGEEKLSTGGSGNYSISLDSLAEYTKTKKDLADNITVDGKVGGVRQELDAHVEDLLNPHQVTKGQIGLGNVDNTTDADKPVSNSTQAAIISAVTPKADKSYVDNQLTLKANKVDVYTKSETYTKQESSDLVNNSISTALTPVNDSLDLAKRGVANRYDPSLTYNSGERVVLANGDIVKSTVDGNTNDPNVDMMGWVKINAASQIFDSNGVDQQTTNNLVRLTSVTPQNFGAIGDGTLHPLSERFSSLAAAKLVYPHATSLTDSIDWAAIQAAHDYAYANKRSVNIISRYYVNKPVALNPVAEFHGDDLSMKLGNSTSLIIETTAKSAFVGKTLGTATSLYAITGSFTGFSVRSRYASQTASTIETGADIFNYFELQGVIFDKFRIYHVDHLVTGRLVATSKIINCSMTAVYKGLLGRGDIPVSTPLAVDCEISGNYLNGGGCGQCPQMLDLRNCAYVTCVDNFIDFINTGILISGNFAFSTIANNTFDICVFGIKAANAKAISIMGNRFAKMNLAQLTTYLVDVNGYLASLASTEFTAIQLGVSCHHITMVGNVGKQVDSLITLYQYNYANITESDNIHQPADAASQVSLVPVKFAVITVTDDGIDGERIILRSLQNRVVENLPDLVTYPMRSFKGDIIKYKGVTLTNTKGRLGEWLTQNGDFFADKEDITVSVPSLAAGVVYTVNRTNSRYKTGSNISVILKSAVNPYLRIWAVSTGGFSYTLYFQNAGTTTIDAANVNLSLFATRP